MIPKNVRVANVCEHILVLQHQPKQEKYEFN